MEKKKTLELARELVSILEEDEKKSKVMLNTLNPGESFLIGEHEFIVLNQRNGSTEVISKNLMAMNISFDDDARDYNKSSLKAYIDKNIRPIIVEEVGECNLVEHAISLESVDSQTEFSDCICDVRPISFMEARQYNNLLVNNDLPDWYWTLTPWSTADRGWTGSIAVVSPSGFIRRSNCFSCGGVRPFCILKSNIFVSKGE